MKPTDKDFLELEKLSGKYGKEYRDAKNKAIKNLIAKGWDYQRINIPHNKKAHEDGSGEGVWALFEETDLARYHSDDSEGKAHVILSNNSFFFPEQICVGDVIEIEFRGADRPVMTWKGEMPNLWWVEDEEFFKTNVNNKKETIRRMLESR